MPDAPIPDFPDAPKKTPKLSARQIRALRADGLKKRASTEKPAEQFPDRIEPPPLLQREIKGKGVSPTDVLLKHLYGWHAAEAIADAKALSDIARRLVIGEDGNPLRSVKARDLNLARVCFVSAADLRARALSACAAAKQVSSPDPDDQPPAAGTEEKPDPKKLSPAERAALGIDEGAAA